MRVDLKGFRYWASGKFWVALWHEINEDNCWGMAAQLSYYFLLAFFPFLLFLSALIGFIPFGQGFIDNLLFEFNRFLPRNAFNLVETTVNSLLESRDQSVLTLSIIFSLWAASLAFNGMIALLNQSYRVRETRSYLKTRSLSILVTIVVSIFMLISGVLLFFGDYLIAVLFETQAVKSTYTVLRWILIFLLFNFAIHFAFFALPARRLPWRLLSPGSVFASLGFLLGSLGFSQYVNRFGGYQQLYGGLGALIVLMLWFYIVSLFLVVGGEMDSEIFKIRRGIDPSVPLAEGEDRDTD